MTEATIKIPGNIDLNKISDEIIYKAFAIAIDKKKKEIKKELKQLDSKIMRFEKRYQNSLGQFESTMGESFQEHNDWMDWSFLEESKKQLLEELKSFESR